MKYFLSVPLPVIQNPLSANMMYVWFADPQQRSICVAIYMIWHDPSAQYIDPKGREPRHLHLVYLLGGLQIKGCFTNTLQTLCPKYVVLVLQRVTPNMLRGGSGHFLSQIGSTVVKAFAFQAAVLGFNAPSGY